MNWKEYIVFAGFLALSSLTPAISQIRTPNRFTPVTPTDVTASVEGTVQDATNKRPVIGAKVMVKNQQGAIRAQQTTSADGKFQLQVDQNQTYALITQAAGYDLKEELLSFTSSSTNRLYGKVIRLYPTGTTPVSQPAQTSAVAATSTEVNLPTATVTTQPSASRTDAGNARVTPPKTLDAKVVYTPPLVVAPVGKTTQLKAIQFVQSKSELLPDAMPALEQLLAFMQSNATAEIELSGHTDNQGDFDENLRLSKQRVDVVKAYLVQNGIEANRITTRGYGPTRPIASNNSESSRQLNRRVEMIVLKQ